MLRAPKSILFKENGWVTGNAEYTAYEAEWLHLKEQPVRSKKGEIEFRRKLYQQQVNGKRTLIDEFDGMDIQRILSDRMNRTYEQMIMLRKSGIPLSPYVEIGSERCQRALVMENDLCASGAALDISYHSLRSCDFYKDKFNKNKIPLRICCDARDLPLMTDSIPFVFCYETLHHFPDPAPVLKEIHRVLLPGGHFFFDEEPFKKMLHIGLYKGRKIYSKESLSASKIRRIIDYFFSTRSCNETEHGIIENADLSINDWRKALSLFKEKHTRLRSVMHIESELVDPKNYLKFILAYLFGGEISGICRKSGHIEIRNIGIRDVLICPSCIENGQESKLVQKGPLFFCDNCRNVFPTSDGIVFLFSHRKLEELYPEIFEKLSKAKRMS